MARLIRAPEALADLHSIVGHIARDNPTAALRRIESVETLFHTLSRQPLMGERCQSHRWGEQRRFLHGHYVVYYRPLDNGVDILRVLHGARDQDTQL